MVMVLKNESGWGEDRKVPIDFTGATRP
jgi:hypothetical protein